MFCRQLGGYRLFVIAFVRNNTRVRAGATDRCAKLWEQSGGAGFALIEPPLVGSHWSLRLVAPVLSLVEFAASTET